VNWVSNQIFVHRISNNIIWNTKTADKSRKQLINREKTTKTLKKNHGKPRKTAENLQKNHEKTAKTTITAKKTAKTAENCERTTVKPQKHSIEFCRNIELSCSSCRYVICNNASHHILNAPQQIKTSTYL
jgi:alpha-beta hydrolase superfamily lysophospholipase